MNAPHRAGRYLQQTTGCKAFVPTPLPPDPPLAYSGELQTLLSAADLDIGRLDALAALLPNPDLFVAMYVRHEAVLPSQTEGTQSTLEDVLAFEADALRDDTPKDVEEIVNCVRAMNHGLARLSELPLSLRLLREIHAELMKGGRGGSLRDAAFIPPPPHELMAALGKLEGFLHVSRDSVPPARALHPCARAVRDHPSLPGRQRPRRRLLITLRLCEERALSRPLPYLSLDLKAHHAEYCDRLTAIRSQGHREAWVAFFLRGVSSTARNAKALAQLDHLLLPKTERGMSVAQPIDAALA
ncbi:MAG: Fic/DOC family N-terminal domain-containing protein [Rubrivivax sp.]|nr:Fic/DOC family N-terminal domain-containing protein [Rubrivivax sp.]